MNCPGSVRMAERRGPRGKHSSFFALEGTAAHTLGAASLRRRLSGEALGARHFLDTWICALTDVITLDYPGSPHTPEGFDPAVAEHVHVPWGPGEYVQAADEWEAAGAPGEGPAEAKAATFRVTPEMADHVDGYVELCLAELERLNEAVGPPAEVMVEQRMDMSWLHPSLGGTGDFIAAKFLDELVVIDLKYGKGVTVEVENNEQELTYVVGAVHETGFDGTRITLWIAQPRKDHPDGPYRKWECTMGEVRAHEALLLERALQTERPNASLRAGEWCTFCPCAGFCPELAEKAMEAAQLDFSAVGTPEVSDVQEMGDEELVRAGRALKMVEAWCKATGARLLERAMDRSPVILEHFKIVRKRANRRWVEGDPTQALAIALGVEAEKFYQPRRLMTPPQVEKMALPPGVKRGQVKAAVSRHVHTPPGGLTLAGIEDPREAVDPTEAAEADFEPVDE